jgi:hypothetical protein
VLPDSPASNVGLCAAPCLSSYDDAAEHALRRVVCAPLTPLHFVGRGCTEC